MSSLKRYQHGCVHFGLTGPQISQSSNFETEGYKHAAEIQESTEHKEQTVPFIFQWDESFDVGMDTGTGVSLVDYQVPFKFNGTIDKLTYDLGPREIPVGGEKEFNEKSKANNSASE